MVAIARMHYARVSKAKRQSLLISHDLLSRDCCTECIVSIICFHYTAPLPSPTILVTTTSATSITLTWEQPEGADAVDRYEINYLYIIEECELEGGRPFPAVTVSINDGTLRRYTLSNSASTPVE